MSLMSPQPSQPRYRQRLGYQAGLLGGICFLVSILLIMGNMSTGPLIEDHLQADKRAMLDQVLEADRYDNDPLAQSRLYQEIVPFSSAVDSAIATQQQQLTARTVQTSIAGWGGDINFILAVDAQGRILGVRVISHTETPGLADKIDIDKSPWINQFSGKSLQNLSKAEWAVKKDGGVFDQFTGATITPRAMVKGVYHSLVFLQNHPIQTNDN